MRLKIKLKTMDQSKYENNSLHQLANRIAHTNPLKIMLGSANVWYGHDWIATNQEDLDILDGHSWQFFLRNNLADVICAEHVWEHFTAVEAHLGICNAFNFLKHGGTLRLAVPDGYFPDPAYIDAVKPGGTGHGADDHKMLWNVDTLHAALFKFPFSEIRPLEWWDKDGKFHAIPWDISKGKIGRSIVYDERNKDGDIKYTSLIIDAIK